MFLILFVSNYLCVTPNLSNSLLVVHKLVPSMVSITFSFRPDEAVFDLTWRKLVFEIKKAIYVTAN